VFTAGRIKRLQLTRVGLGVTATRSAEYNVKATIVRSGMLYFLAWFCKVGVTPDPHSLGSLRFAGGVLELQHQTRAAGAERLLRLTPTLWALWAFQLMATAMLVGVSESSTFDPIQVRG
jgi:hypothetical protein